MAVFRTGGSTGSDRSNSIGRRDADRTAYAAKQQQRRNTRNARSRKHGYGTMAGGRSA